jgi:hypothetical protein
MPSIYTVTDRTVESTRLSESTRNNLPALLALAMQYNYTSTHPLHSEEYSIVKKYLQSRRTDELKRSCGDARDRNFPRL